MTLTEDKWPGSDSKYVPDMTDGAEKVRLLGE